MKLSLESAPLAAVLAILSATASAAPQVELLPITAANDSAISPKGKEADAIHGDFVLRNEHIVAVIARPVAGRNANMTTRNVGGGLIDLTRRDSESESESECDQLSAFYPGGTGFRFTDPRALEILSDPPVFPTSASSRRRAKTFTVVIRSAPNARGIRQTVRYTLRAGWHHVLVESLFENTSDKPALVFLEDHVRADRTFRHGRDTAANMHWVADEWFRQAYGFQPIDHELADTKTGNRPFKLRYLHRGTQRVELQPGNHHSLRRRILPASSQLQLAGRARATLAMPTRTVRLHISDPAGPIHRATVIVSGANELYGRSASGPGPTLAFLAPRTALRARIEAIGRPTVELSIPAGQEDVVESVRMALPAIVVGAVTDEFGRAIPCKISFKGIDGTRSPHFGPDSAAFGVHNLVYTANGRFRRELPPGSYRVVISYGPEFDMVEKQIQVARGGVFTLAARLRRTVDTTGWISTDFHSHSTPSGDNTSMTIGRVLNLLAEHIEFAPCTEHNRLSTYEPFLVRLGAVDRMATCVGMELTGSDGESNHQNAFPLIMRRGQQDNGAPRTAKDPVVQIERLALWDDQSEKLVQSNHPRLEKILGDRNLDGKPDSGYERMMSLMDVVEIHPPHLIFQKVAPNATGKTFNNRMFRWLQALNTGYRVPGVVNTDAHYNFHGSGWLRNYVKCATDDPTEIKTLDIVHECERGHIVMTNGPFMEVTFEADGTDDRAIPGDEIQVTGGKGKLHVRVQCANWLDVNRVQLFLNGRPEKTLNFTRKTHAAMFGGGPGKAGVVKFDQRIDLALKGDTHVIAAAVGEGLTLGPVFDGPHGRDRPIAVSNPIFLDVDGGGFQSNGDTLGVPLPRVK